MAEIEFRLPSNVPYGYVNVRYEVNQDGPPEPSVLGALYANYVMAFAEAERAALDAYGKPSAAPVAPPEPEVDQGPDVHEGAVQAVTEGLGATVVDEGEAAYDAAYSAPNDGPEPAPWEKGAEASQPKPWENSKRAAEDVRHKANSDTVATKAAAVIEW